MYVWLVSSLLVGGGMGWNIGMREVLIEVYIKYEV